MRFSCKTSMIVYEVLKTSNVLLWNRELILLSVSKVGLVVQRATNSLLLVWLLMSKIDTYFPKVRMLFYLSNFHTASRAPCSCHSVSSLRPILKFWSIGVMLIRITWTNKSFRLKDFGLECQRDVQRLVWISHVGLVSACLSSSVRLTTTSAPPCPEIHNPIVVFHDPHPTSPWFNSWRVSRFTTYCQVLSCKSCFFQHGYCTFVMILCGPLTSLFFNLTMCIRTLFPKCASTLGLVVCWRRILQQTPSPWRECTTDLPLNWPRWSWRVERTAWGCWGMREGKWKWCKRSKKSERTLNSCMHVDNHGIEWDKRPKILSQCTMCKKWVWQHKTDYEDCHTTRTYS